jgi:hypothetical protein
MTGRRQPTSALGVDARRSRLRLAWLGNPTQAEWFVADGDNVTRFTHPHSLRLWFSTVMAFAIASAMSIFVGFVEVPVASADTASVAQCNADTYPTGAGYQATCTLTVVNTITAAGAESSVVTTTACLAAAGVLPPSGCTTETTSSEELTTTISQCLGIVGGGGSNLTCNVVISNDVPADSPTAAVSVYQCVGSDNGGGGTPPDCSPSGSIVTATVNQCNGSSTGGGSTLACSVSGAVTAIPLSIQQCNGSANGGGSNVTCSVSVGDDFTAPGVLSISAPTGPVSLGSQLAITASSTMSGPLGVVTVSDQRGGTTTWTASVISGPFTPAGGPADPASNLSYAAGPITVSADVVATAIAATDLTGESTVVTGSSTGLSAASWNPTITVIVPANFAPGVYSATITHSVA